MSRQCRSSGRRRTHVVGRMGTAVASCASPRDGDARTELAAHAFLRGDRGRSRGERDTGLERALVLPAWVDGQLEAANLDVRTLEGSDGFYRLRSGKVRVVFKKLGRDVVVHRIARRDDVYEGLDELRLI